MEHHKKDNIYSGTSGLVLPVPNKQLFPPVFQDKSRLTYYASIFNSIEINSSFYKVPMASTVQKWAASVPEGFKFTFKLWKGITHNKGLTFNPEDVDLFIQTITHSGDKKGCLLVQFPPSLVIANAGQVEKLLISIRQVDPELEWKIALEFRNRSWYQEDIYDLLHQYRAEIVLHDMPASATPLIDENMEFIYLRFHGPDGDYKGNYTDDFLSEYAQYVKTWKQDGKDVYIYFNNTAGDAIKNLMTLNEFVNL